MILFLDDNADRAKTFEIRNPNQEWTWVQTADEAIQRLSDSTPWTSVHLDHDLGNEIFVDSRRSDCGMEVVRWIVANRPRIMKIIVHTWNIPAGKRMVTALTDSGYRAIYKPFPI